MNRSAGLAVTALAPVLATAAAIALADPDPGPAAVAVPAAAPPNVLVVMTDDQDSYGLAAMPRTRKLIGRAGARFRRSFTEFPLCCPSRATFLTGRYSHNHGVRDNQPPNGGFTAFDSSETLPVWLRRAGYETAHIGKYLNGYGNPATSRLFVPPGWSEWHTTVDPSTYRYYDYTMNENGLLIRYGNSPADLVTDVVTAKATTLIDRWAAAGARFFLTVSYFAPHISDRYTDPEPATPPCDRTDPRPALRHGASITATDLPRPPSFNEQRVFDKPRALHRPPLDRAEIAAVERLHRCRIASLRAVDEGVARLIGALRRGGLLDSTYVIFTSDNGFELGQHRIKQGKDHIYDESLRVPLLIRGPAVSPGSHPRELAVNADLAPTILEITGARAARSVDGISLLGALADPARRSGRVLPVTTTRAAGVQTARYTYARTAATGEVELYDNLRDPYQLRNRADAAAYASARRRLARLASRFGSCAAASCRALPKLHLRLSDARGPLGANRCARGAVRARLGGPAATQLDRVRWRLGRRIAGRGPGIRIPGGTLSDKAPRRLRAVAMLTDGRDPAPSAWLRRCR